MPTTISTSATLTVRGDNKNFSKSENTSTTQTGDHWSGQIQTVGTTYEALNISSDIATPGEMFAKNLDNANFVEIGLEVAATFYPFAKLKAGQIMKVPLAVSGIFARANTADVKLEFWVIED